MINYDKWKLLNENFMSSQPLGIKKNNGFLAYNKLHEDEEIEDDDVEDMDDEDRENMDGEEDEYEDEYEDEDEDHEEMEDEEYEDMEQEEDEDDEYEIEHEEDEDDEDEGPMMGRVRSHHHSHDKHLSRPHHEMDTDEIDFAAKASDKMSRMYASCESMEYKMPSMNEWLSSVNGMMFPEELNDYIGKKGNVINELAKQEDEEEEEEDKAKLASKLEQIKKRIDEAADSLNTIQQKQFVELLSYFINKLKPKVTVNTVGSASISTKLKSLTLMLNDFLGIDNSEKSILDRTKSSMNSPKYMKKGGNKKGCGMMPKKMKMMPKKMKMMPKKMKMSSKNMKSCSSKNMKKSTKR
jgi:hypothetical protein